MGRKRSALASGVQAEVFWEFRLQAGNRWSLCCGTLMIHVAYSALFSQTTLTNLLL
jgi:hypothetical protein